MEYNDKGERRVQTDIRIVDRNAVGLVLEAGRWGWGWEREGPGRGIRKGESTEREKWNGRGNL